MSETDSSYHNPYENMTVSQIAERMRDVVDRLAGYEEVRKKLQKEYDDLRKIYLPEAMTNEGVTNINITDVGRITLRSDIYVSVPAVDREVAYDWLRGTGHGGIIKETVNANTLRSTVKEMLRKGEALPDPTVLKVTPYDVAVLTRKKKGESTNG